MAIEFREDILKRFYIDRPNAIKNIALAYLEKEFNDFFDKYNFDKKNVIDYDKDIMRKHIIFDLLRMLGDPGYRVYEILMDYVSDIYNRESLKYTAIANFEKIKLKDVN